MIKLTSKFEAIKAVKGGPKTIQHAKAVNESTQDRIKIYISLIKFSILKNMYSLNQFYFKKICIYIINLLVLTNNFNFSTKIANATMFKFFKKNKKKLKIMQKLLLISN